MNQDADNPPDPPPQPEALHDPYAALRIPEFRRYLLGHTIGVLGLQMQTVAVGWEIYERTHAPLSLGIVGLVQVLPMITLAIPAGQIIDRFDRRRVVMVATILIILAATGLAWITYAKADTWTMYACLLLVGIARTLQQPAKASLLPQIVPRERFSNAVAWSMGAFQVAGVTGPALGGVLIESTGTASVVFLLDALAALCFLCLLATIRIGLAPPPREAVTFRSLGGGLSFVWHNKILLGCMTLDMLAVLLGGATALLPVYAKDILHVGPVGLGVMQAAPAVGALVMAIVVTHLPPFRAAGKALLWAVVAFGLATIVFGISRWFWLSLAMLLLTGAADQVSVVVRHTLVQLLTPDHLRGRVSAVNSMFIGTSNELGGFESGFVAHLIGPVLCVAGGGVGTILVAAVVALAWPQIRRYGRLDGREGERLA